MNKKKLLALLLALVMTFSLVPVTAFAEGGELASETATYVAWIGETGYETLEAAINAASATDTITLGEGEYTTYGTTYAQGKTLTFVGQGTDKTTWGYGTTIPYSGEHGSDYSLEGANVTFKNLKLHDYYSKDTDFRGIVRASSLVFENCVIDSFSHYQGVDLTVFKNCTFENTGVYNICTYSASTYVFDGCTFYSSKGKFINVYKEAGASNTNIYVNNCSFIVAADASSTVGTSSDAKYACLYLKTENPWTVYFTGNNSTQGVLDGSNTGNKLFNDNKLGTSTSVYSGGTFSYVDGAPSVTGATLIWENGAAVEATSTAVAKIGEMEYETLQGAINAAQDGDTVKLVADLTGDTALESRVDVDASDKSITIDLGGHSINVTHTTGNGSAFNIKSGTVTIQNGTIDGTGVAEGDGSNIAVANGICLVTVRSGATLNLVDGINMTVNSKNGCCVYPFDGGQVNISGGTYENKTTEDYQWKTGFKGLVVNQANVTTQLVHITGGTFIGNNPGLGDDNGAKFLDDGYAAVEGTNSGTWVIKPTVSTGGETTVAVDTTQKTTVTVDTSELDDTFKEKVQELGVTTVTGVELTTTAAEGETSGLQAVVNAAAAGGEGVTAKDANDNALEAGEAATKISEASTIAVEVNVTVTPTEYTVNSSAAFKLTPEATVTTKNASGDTTAIISGVAVTNDMIDKTQDITVKIYTGFEPAQIVHVDDYGNVIEVFTGSDITFANGVATVTISHFSTLLANATANVAQIGSTGYATLADAVVAAQSAATKTTITLLDNIVLNSTVAIEWPKTASGSALSIDLNGHNITATDCRALWIKTGYVTLTGSGTISSVATENSSFSKDSSVIRVGSTETTAQAAASLEVKAGVAVSTTHCYGIAVFGNNSGTNGQVLNFYGTVTTTDRPAIAGNGTSSLTTTMITVNGGASVSATNEYAIYHPQAGTLSVKGTVSGQGGVEMKAGTLTLDATGSITASGTASHPGINNNGTSTSGYAIALVENSGYKGGAKANISKGTINGTIGIIVDNTVDSSKKATLAVSGGSFSLAVPAEYCADGFSPVTTQDVNGMYTVETTKVAQIGDEKYTTLAAAIKAVENGQIITLLADTSIDYLKGYKKYTLDLGTYTLTAGFVDIDNGGDVTIQNGTIGIDGGDGYFMYIYSTDDTTKGAGEYSKLTIASTAVVNGDVVMWGEYNDASKGYGAQLDIAGKVNGCVFVSGNIKAGNNVINVTGEINTDEDVGIALNGNATLNIQAGASIHAQESVSNATGVEVRAGTLTMTGGTVTGKGEYTVVSNGNGTTSTGAGIAIVQHTTKLPIEANLSGGTVTATDHTKAITVAAVEEGTNMAVVEVKAEATFVQNHDTVPAGYQWVETATEGVYELQKLPDVAQIGDVGYATLAAAVEAAVDGNTIELLQNVELSAGIDVDKDIILDLNGKTISNASGITTDYLLGVKHGGTLTVNDTASGGKISMSKDYCAIKMTVKGDTTETYAASLTVNAGTIEGYDFAISGNGSTGRGNVNITINGGTIRNTKTTGSGDDAAIYMPNTGTVTLNGGTITGLTGVELRSGTLSIPASSTVVITGTGDPASYQGNGNGTTTFGAGIAIAQHTTDNAINVSIAGGTVYGAYALAVVNPNSRTVNNVTVAVSGGTFIGTGTSKTALNVNDTRVTKFVSGGYFSEQVGSDYVADGYTATNVVDENGLYTVTSGTATYSATLTLNDNINVNFYVKSVSEEEAAKYTVSYEFNGQSGTLSLPTEADSSGRYKVVFPEVYSYQMGETIDITVNYGGEAIKHYTYSASTYFHNTINKSGTDATTLAVCKAALDYGAAAQLYFDGRTYNGGVYDTNSANLVNADTNPTNDVTASQPGDTYAAAKSGSIQGISKYSATLVLGSETSIKVYLTGDASNVTVSCTDSMNESRTVTQVEADGSRYSFRVTGIKATDLDKEFTITITKGGVSTVLTYSPYTYARNKWTDSELGPVVKALVAYGTAARTLWPNT